MEYVATSSELEDDGDKNSHGQRDPDIAPLLHSDTILSDSEGWLKRHRLCPGSADQLISGDNAPLANPSRWAPTSADPTRAHGGLSVHGVVYSAPREIGRSRNSNPVWLHNDQCTAFQAISNGFERCADSFGSLLGAPSRSTQKHDAWLRFTR